MADERGLGVGQVARRYLLYATEGEGRPAIGVYYDGRVERIVDGEAVEMRTDEEMAGAFRAVIDLMRRVGGANSFGSATEVRDGS